MCHHIWIEWNQWQMTLQFTLSLFTVTLQVTVQLEVSGCLGITHSRSKWLTQPTVMHSLTAGLQCCFCWPVSDLKSLKYEWIKKKTKLKVYWTTTEPMQAKQTTEMNFIIFTGNFTLYLRPAKKASLTLTVQHWCWFTNRLVYLFVFIIVIIVIDPGDRL